MTSLDRAFIKAYKQRPSDGSAGQRPRVTDSLPSNAGAILDPSPLYHRPKAPGDSPGAKTRAVLEPSIVYHDAPTRDPENPFPYSDSDDPSALYGEPLLPKSPSVALESLLYDEPRAVAAGTFDHREPLTESHMRGSAWSLDTATSAGQVPSLHEIAERSPASDDSWTPALPLPASSPRYPLSAVSALASFDGPVHPQLQVDRFIWPELCERLASRAADRFAKLASTLTAESRRGHKLILITSTCRAQGCSTVVLAFARHLVTTGLRVALVDGDCHEPVLAARLGIAPQVGWEEVLAGHVPLSEALIESVADRLALLPQLGRSLDRALVLGNPRLERSLSTLRRHYDLVLVDCGALDSGGLIAATSAGTWLADGRAILVRDLRNATDQDRREGMERLAAASVPLLGIAENFER